MTASGSEDLSVYDLIKAVSKKPGLYNKSDVDYSKEERERLWIKVCEEITPDWNKLTEPEKNSRLVLVPRKWKNLRDNFKKALNRKKHENSKNGKRRREYIYYKALQFLEPYVKASDDQDQESQTSDKDNFEDDNSTDIKQYESESSSLNFNNIQRGRDNQFRNTDIMESTNFVLDDDIDEDRYFLLSLLTTFKNLPPNEKINVKIEFLQILQKIGFPCSESSPKAEIGSQSQENEDPLNLL